MEVKIKGSSKDF